MARRTSPAQDAALAAVQRAAEDRRRAEEAYREAIRAAVDEAATYAAIGRAAGVSPEAVRQMSERVRD